MLAGLQSICSCSGKRVRMAGINAPRHLRRSCRCVSKGLGESLAMEHRLEAGTRGR